jgi:alpha-beta hydrolase superfamily lysophospholipase
VAGQVPVGLVSTTTADGVTLHGAYLPADPVPRASTFDAVLMMHGVANTFSSSLGPGIAEMLAAHGYATVRANNRGHDIVSRGSAAQPYLGAAFERLPDSVHDWTAWLDWLGARGYRRILLCGHSLGGVKTAYVMATAPHPAVGAVVLYSPPRFSYESWMQSPRAQEFRDHLARAQALVDAGTPDALFPVTMPVAFIAGAAAYIAKYGPDARFDVFDHMVRIGVPVLAFTGAREFADIAFRDHPDQYEAATGKKADLTHQVVPDADHFYTDKEPWVAERVLAWLHGMSGGSPHVQ